jgi:hypothetical protein
MNAEDELCLRIGRAARAHVEIDIALRSVFTTLTSPALGMYLVDKETSTARVVQDIKIMLKEAPLSPEVLAGAKVALAAALVAGEDRNRIVHDSWFPDFDAPDGTPPRWMSSGKDKGLGRATVKPPRDLRWLDTKVHGLWRTVTQVQGLDWALKEALIFDRRSVRDPDGPMGLNVWIKAMEGRFDLSPDHRSWSPHR